MSSYREYAIYSIRGSLGTDIMPKWNKLTFLRVSWRQLCQLLISSRHTGVRSLLVSYRDSNVWPDGLLQGTVVQWYPGRRSVFDLCIQIWAFIRWRPVHVLYFPDTEFHTYSSGQVPISSHIHVVRTFPDMSGARPSCRSWPDCSLRPFP